MKKVIYMVLSNTVSPSEPWLLHMETYDVQLAYEHADKIRKQFRHNGEKRIVCVEADDMESE